MKYLNELKEVQGVNRLIELIHDGYKIIEDNTLYDIRTVTLVKSIGELKSAFNTTVVNGERFKTKELTIFNDGTYEEHIY